MIVSAHKLDDRLASTNDWSVRKCVKHFDCALK